MPTDTETGALNSERNRRVTRFHVLLCVPENVTALPSRSARISCEYQNTQQLHQRRKTVELKLK
jgi:hypothetical protein